MRTARRIGGLAIATMVVLAFAPVALAADHDVSIAGSAFDPPTITIAVGDSVTWANSDAINHTASGDDGEFDTGILGGGASAAIIFATAGTYAYHCEIHTNMTGEVVVEGADTAGAADDNDDQARVTQAPTDAIGSTPGDPGDTTRALIATLIFLGVAMLVGTAIAQRRYHDRRP